MSDYKQTRDAAGRVTTQYDKMLRNIDDDLVKQLQNPRPMSMFLTRADQAKDWTELLRAAADRIEELSNCVAVLEAKLAKAVELLEEAAPFIGYSAHVPDIDSAVWDFLIELKGQKDD